MASYTANLFSVGLREGPIEVSVLTYGALIQSLIVPDRHDGPGRDRPWFADLDDYVGEHPYFGATIGRYANRIDRGRFLLDGTQYQLPVNNAPNCMHGGASGFDRRVWEATETTQATASGYGSNSSRSTVTTASPAPCRPRSP